MSRIILCLCLAFSLFVAPVLCAAGLDCVKDSCHQTGQTKHGKAEKKTVAAADHHCCCTPACLKSEAWKLDLFSYTHTQHIFFQEGAAISAIVLPPLEPPSHA